MGLSNDFLYPRYLVVVLVRNDKGEFVYFHSVAIFATRSDLLQFISRYREELSASLRSDSFGSYSYVLTPVFRVYHLTRAKI